MVNPMFSGILRERKVGMNVVSVEAITQSKQNPEASLCKDRVCRLEGNVKTREGRIRTGKPWGRKKLLYGEM
jgi:hypothetical protein